MHPIQRPLARVDLSTAGVLRRAALYVQRHGFHQGDMFADPTQLTPAACAQGAIKMAVCGGPSVPYTPDQAMVVDIAICVLAEYLDLVQGNEPPPWYRESIDAVELVGNWNDEIGRTADQLVTTLTDAAQHSERLHGATTLAHPVQGGAS